jgi:hypothetical protein
MAGKAGKKPTPKPSPQMLGTGQARRAAEGVRSRNARNQAALAAASAALGRQRKAQTTDSSNR